MSIHSFLTDSGDDDRHEARLDAELAETEALFGAELKALLDPDAGLSARTRLEVNEALLARSALSLTVDLMSVGWQTVRVMFGPPDDPSRNAGPPRGSNDPNSNEEVRS